MHVTVDGHRRSRTGPQWTEPAARGFCYKAIRLAEMKLIDGPHSREADGHIYAQAMLAESHVQVQLDVYGSLAYLEMFSCRDFDSQGFVNHCRATFNLDRVRVQILVRGLQS